MTGIPQRQQIHDIIANFIRETFGYDGDLPDDVDLEDAGIIESRHYEQLLNGLNAKLGVRLRLAELDSYDELTVNALIDLSMTALAKAAEPEADGTR